MYGLVSYLYAGRLVAEKIHLNNSIKQIDSDKKADILSLVEILIKKYDYNIIFEKWLDIGHEATYLDIKLASISSRFFNNIFFLEKNNSQNQSQELFLKNL